MSENETESASSQLTISQHYIREAEILRTIALQSTATFDIDELLQNVTPQLAQSLIADVVTTWLLDPLQERLVVHQPSVVGSTEEAGYQSIPIEDESFIGTIYRLGTSFLSNDLSLDEEEVNRTYAQELNLKSLIAAPIPARKRVRGVMVVGSTTDHRFSEEDLRLLETAAGQLGILTSNAELYEQERKRADLLHLINRISSELSTMLDLNELSQRIVESIRQTFQYENVYLMMYEDGRLIVRAMATSDAISHQGKIAFPVTNRVAGRVIRTARSYIVRDVNEDPDFVMPEGLSDIQSLLAVPLRARSEVIGVLALYSSEYDAFTQTDKEAMETLSSQVGTAIENATLYQEAQKRLQELSIVYQVGQDINSIADIPSLADTLVYQVANALATTGCALMLFDVSEDRISLQAEYNSQSTDRLLSPNQIAMINDYIMAIRSALYVNRIVNLGYADLEPDTVESRLLEELQQSAVLIVPMVASGEPLGYMVWLDDRHTHPFADPEVRLAQTLTNQASVALERAHLQEETRRQLQREKMLRRVAETASNYTDRRFMLMGLTDETNRALRASKCNIYLLNDEVLELMYGQVAVGTPPPIHINEVINLSETPSIREALNEGSLVTLQLDQENISDAETAHLRRQGYASMMLAPMIAQNALVGALEVLDDRPNRVFSLADQSLLEGLANQVSIAIDNARLYQEEQQRRALLEKIQTTSQDIAGELQVESLLDTAVSSVAAVFDVDAADILQQDPESASYRVSAAFNLSSPFIAGRTMSPNQFRQQYQQGGTPSITLVDDTLDQADLFQQEGIQTIFSIPLLRGHIVFGALNLYMRAPRSFTDNERDMAQLLARQISISVDNAHLFEMLEERARELAESNRLKNEFLANISHELRTPMNSIIGFTDTVLIGMYGDLNEKQTDRLGKVKRNALHLLELIDDLLDLSKIEAGHMSFDFTDVDVVAELQEICATFEPNAQAKSLILEQYYDDDLPIIWADPGRLKQVFNNLMTNALKFTPEGTITIRAITDTFENRPVVHISITDTGIGIPEHNLEIIFDEFRQGDGSATRQYEGTGMGLAICRRLLDLMDGHIWAESQPDMGSTFHVVLPQKRAEHAD